MINNSPLNQVNDIYLSICKIPGVSICGGSVNQLVNSSNHKPRNQDIDIFIYGNIPILKTMEKIFNILFSSIRSISQNDKIIQIVSDTNFLKDIKHEQVIQIIKRQYKTLNEILLGFDLDSSSVGISTKNNNLDVYYLNRYRLSVEYSINVINPFRQSFSYNYRLYKYALRGVIPFCPFLIPKNVSFSDEEKIHKHKLSSLIFKLVGNQNFNLKYKEESDYTSDDIEYIYKNKNKYLAKRILENNNYLKSNT